MGESLFAMGPGQLAETGRLLTVELRDHWWVFLAVLVAIAGLAFLAERLPLTAWQKRQRQWMSSGGIGQLADWLSWAVALSLLLQSFRWQTINPAIRLSDDLWGLILFAWQVLIALSLAVPRTRRFGSAGLLALVLVTLLAHGWWRLLPQLSWLGLAIWLWTVSLRPEEATADRTRPGGWLRWCSRHNGLLLRVAVAGALLLTGFAFQVVLFGQSLRLLAEHPGLNVLHVFGVAHSTFLLLLTIAEISLGFLLLLNAWSRSVTIALFSLLLLSGSAIGALTVLQLLPYLVMLAVLAVAPWRVRSEAGSGLRFA